MGVGKNFGKLELLYSRFGKNGITQEYFSLKGGEAFNLGITYGGSYHRGNMW